MEKFLLDLRIRPVLWTWGKYSVVMLVFLLFHSGADRSFEDLVNRFNTRLCKISILKLERPYGRTSPGTLVVSVADTI